MRPKPRRDRCRCSYFNSRTRVGCGSKYIQSQATIFVQPAYICTYLLLFFCSSGKIFHYFIRHYVYFVDADLPGFSCSLRTHTGRISYHHILLLFLICHFSKNLVYFYKKKGPVSRSFPYLSFFQEYINLLLFSFTAFQIELPAFLIPFQAAEPTTLAAEATFFALL